MGRITITNAKIITPQGIKGGELYIEGKKISKNKKPGALKINAKGLFVSPGFIDLHIHGDPVKISKREARFGTTSFLCGIRETKPNRIRALLKQLEQANEKTGTKALGFYLEGPYVNPNMRGALLRNWVKKPVLKELKEAIKASKGKMKVITVAPEVKGMTGLIKYMKEKNIIPSIGHTDATYKEAIRGIDAGASLATHTFNRMRLMDQREPAASGAVLLDKRVAAEVMLDNIHVHPALLKLLILCKGDDKIVLVTDSVASGPIAGTRKCGKVYKTKEGAFAGGSLTMNQAVRNGAKAGARIDQVVKMASLNPAKVLGIDRRKGSLDPGKDADIIIFDKNFDVRMTIVDGQIVYKK